MTHTIAATRPSLFDDSGVNTETGRIRWHDIIAVGIRTTAEDPISKEVLWQFLLRDRLVEAAGSLLTDLDPMRKRLPGLDLRKVIEGTGTRGRIFRVWHHEESPCRPTEFVLRRRFVDLVERLGASNECDQIFARIYAAWSSASRRYHDVEHLTDCLREVDRLPSSFTRDLVELALWYHDAVYEPGATDCEQRSSAWLMTDTAALGLADRPARIAAALVEMTAHGAARMTSDEGALVADIDLSILGKDPLRFMDFEHSVEEEFGAMPPLAFRVGRGRFLDHLLEGPIFRTKPFRDRFEVTARANIRTLLGSPRYAAYR